MSKILIIDSNKSALQKYRKDFAENYEVHIAEDIQEAESVINSIEELAVIIIGSHIPDEQGIDFFEKTKTLFYNSVRIFVSSVKDFDIAIKAVNRCYVFRFHLDPCDKSVLKKSIDDALDLYWKQRDIYRRAISDSLTGLINRGRLMEQLEKELARSMRYKNQMSVVMVDIDFFKKINDNYGHQEGDLVLKECSEIFISCKRDTDTIGRYGGEEFLFILPETSCDNSIIFCDRVRQKIAKSIFGVNGIHVTVSLGISEVRDDDTLTELISRADMALYTAKELGRNRVESL